MNERTNPFAVIELDGHRYTSRDEGLILSLQIELTTDKSSQAVMVVSDPRFVFTDRHLSSDGMRQLEASFWLGFGEAAQLGEAVYSGLLVEYEWQNGETTMVFHDKSSRMKQQKKARYHKRVSDLGLMRKIVQEYGYTFSGPTRKDDGDVHDDLIQFGRTDWQLLREVARRQGLRIWVHGDTFYAREAARVGSPVRSISIFPNDSLLRDYRFGHKLPEHKHGRPRRVQYRGRGEGGKLLVGDSDDSTRGVDEVEIKRDLPTHSRSAARRRAQGRKDRKREHAFSGHLTLIPDYSEGETIRLRDTVEVVNAGDFNSGLWLVDPMRYEFGPGRLTHTLDIYRDIK